MNNTSIGVKEEKSKVPVKTENDTMNNTARRALIAVKMMEVNSSRNDILQLD